MAVGNETYTITIEGRNLLSDKFAAMSADMQALTDAAEAFTKVQQDQARAVNGWTQGNEDLNDVLQEQADRQRELQELMIRLGGRVAETEEERIEIAHKALEAEMDTVLTRAQSLDATNEQITAIGDLYIKLHSQVEAQRAVQAAVEETSVATRAGTFAVGVMEKAWVSIKRALLVAPLVAGIQGLVNLLVEGVTGMFDFGDATDHAADAQKRLADNLEATVEAAEKLRASKFAAVLGAPRLDAMTAEQLNVDLLIKRLLDPTQFTDKAGAPTGISGHDLTAIVGAGAVDLSSLPGYQAALAEFDARVDGMRKMFERNVAIGAVKGTFDQDFAEETVRRMNGEPLIPRDEALEVLMKRQAELATNVAAEKESTDALKKSVDELNKTFGSSHAIVIPDLNQGYASFGMSPTQRMMYESQLGYLQSPFTGYGDQHTAQVGMKAGQDPLLLWMSQNMHYSPAAAAEYDKWKKDVGFAGYTQPGQVGMQGPVLPAGTNSFSFADAAQGAAESADDAMAALDSNIVSQFGDELADVALNFDSAAEAAADFGRAVVQALVDIAAAKTAAFIFSGPSGWFGEAAATTVTAQANGGLMTGDVQSFAGGGIAYGQQLVQIADNPSHVEAFVPLPDGKTIPVTMRGGQGGASITINVSMPVQAIDTRDFDSRLNERGRVLGNVIARELETNRGLQHVTRSISRSAG